MAHNSEKVARAMASIEWTRRVRVYAVVKAQTWLSQNAGATNGQGVASAAELKQWASGVLNSNAQLEVLAGLILADPEVITDVTDDGGTHQVTDATINAKIDQYIDECAVAREEGNRELRANAGVPEPTP